MGCCSKVFSPFLLAPSREYGKPDINVKTTSIAITCVVVTTLAAFAAILVANAAIIGLKTGTPYLFEVIGKALTMNGATALGSLGCGWILLTFLAVGIYVTAFVKYYIPPRPPLLIKTEGTRQVLEVTQPLCDLKVLENLRTKQLEDTPRGPLPSETITYYSIIKNATHKDMVILINGPSHCNLVLHPSLADLKHRRLCIASGGYCILKRRFYTQTFLGPFNSEQELEAAIKSDPELKSGIQVASQ